MTDKRYRNYKHERKWLEIIRVEKEKVETPTEKIRKELEESVRVEKEIASGLLKKEDADKIMPTLKELLLDELDAVVKYGELLILLKRVSIATAMLEEETRTISKILEDKMRHEEQIRRIIRELGGE